MSLTPERMASLRRHAESRAYALTCSVSPAELLALLDAAERAERYEKAINSKEVAYAIRVLNGTPVTLTRNQVVRALTQLHDIVADASTKCENVWMCEIPGGQPVRSRPAGQGGGKG